MYSMKLMFLFGLVVVIFTACSKSPTVDDWNKGSSAKNLIENEDNDIISLDDNNSNIELIIFKDDNVSQVAIKKKVQINAFVKKTIVFKKKLRKCGVEYEPWADRLDKDLIVMPKLLKTCESISKATKGYILHSTKQVHTNKHLRGYTVGDHHLFIPYIWSSKDMNTALNLLNK